ncbi:putative tubulin polyglutamylase TTLL2 [Lycorma delicatula]|uniref:putative tubulin polyglutamylase TTLL2 n=1 Tax=Lycorma delicatula TaxID=130591 RepID=UPI003F51A5AA
MSFENGPFVFRINDNGSGPNLLLQVCLERGWREYNENGVLKDNWNLWWRTGGFPTSHYKQLKPWQFTNHIPKGSSICRKDNLSRYLKCMKKIFGTIYDFSPDAFNLPLEYTKLVAECSRQKNNNYEDPSNVWICKPVGQSQGRGISLFKKLSELVYDSNAVVQRYVQNPLLIGGYKFDLRLYVCVPSFHPPAIYLYREGLARFSTDKFSLSNLDNPFAHLTNTSLNKQGPRYTEMKDRVGAGCKWSLKQLRHYFNQSGFDDWLLWQRISSLVVLTVISQLNNVPTTSNCFEFYGFDVLVDSTLRPWLLEVNLSPALGNHCDVDPAVKKPMLHDMFDLLGLPVCCTGLSLFTIWSTGVCNTCITQVTTNNNNNKKPSESIEESNIITADNEKCDKNQRSASQTAITVVTMANRWRRMKQQSAVTQSSDFNKNRRRSNKNSNTCNSYPSSANNRTKSINRQVKSARPQPKKVNALLPTINIGEEYNENNNNIVNEQLKNISNIISMNKNKKPSYKKRIRTPPLSLWGNGKDWENPPAQEGDWVRVYPLGEQSKNMMWDNHHNNNQHEFNNTMFGDKEIRSVVINMSKHFKFIKEVFKKNVNTSDEIRNESLMKMLGLSGTVWLPNK